VFPRAESLIWAISSVFALPFFPFFTQFTRFSVFNFMFI
jgi:hypothetical protein